MSSGTRKRVDLRRFRPTRGLLPVTCLPRAVLGAWPQWGLWLVVVFLVGVTPQIHNFWAVSDGMQRMGELTHFMKNVALPGAALALLKLAETQPWPFSVSR